MKKIILLSVAAVLWCFTLNAQTEINPNGYNIFYHPNGQKSSEGMMRDGKPDGYWKTYNENGILISEGNRKNFELDSTWRFYDDAGRIKMEINYRQGKKNGIRKTYREGELLEESFMNDLKQGPTNEYYPNGRLRKTVNFSEGLENGLAKEFDTDGRIITLITYKNGFITDREPVNRYDNNNQKHGNWKYYYDSGNLHLEGTYKHGLENGYFKEYDLNGNLMSTSKYTDGVKLENVAELTKLDVRKDYYPDGKLKIAATYNKEGKPEGVRREYSEDGTVERSYIFKNGIIIGEGVITDKGERDGTWKEYFDDGKLKAEGRYNKDIKTGIWKFYHESGTVEQEGSYNKDGKPEGEWSWFYENGEVLRTENYYMGKLDGKMTEFDHAGNIITEGSYIEGKEDGAWHYIMGKSEVEGSYADGMRTGIWKSYDLPDTMGEKPVLRFEGGFIEDNPHGKHVYYWENGKIKDEGDYTMGLKNGDWTYYNFDGTPFLVVSYKNGVELKYDGIKITPELNEEEQPRD